MLTALSEGVKRICYIVQHAGRHDSPFFISIPELPVDSIPQPEKAAVESPCNSAFPLSRPTDSISRAAASHALGHDSSCVPIDCLRSAALAREVSGGPFIAAVRSRRAGEKRRGSKACGDRFSSAVRRVSRWKDRWEREQGRWSSDLPQSAIFPKDRLQTSPDFVRL